LRCSRVRAARRKVTRTKSGHTFARVFQRNIEDTSNERDRIISVLYEANWNKAKAADLLKISRMTLYRKMEKFGISCRGRAA